MCLRLVERVPWFAALPGGAGLREVHGGCIRGRWQVHGLAVLVESLGMPGVRGIWPGSARRVVSPAEGTWPDVLLPAVFRLVRACTWLSVELAAREPARTYI